jgi:prepilin-type processing-associated H-X9-DG protein
MVSNFVPSGKPPYAQFGCRRVRKTNFNRFFGLEARGLTAKLRGMSTLLPSSARWKTSLLLSLAVCGVLALLAYTIPLRAQSVAPVNTPEQVTRAFVALLKPEPRRRIPRFFAPAGNIATRSVDEVDSEDGSVPSLRDLAPALKNIIARKSFNQLSEEGAAKLFREIADTPPPLQWQVLGGQDTDPNSKTATIQVTPQSNAAFPVVCIREENAWRVDLVETFGKWFGLNRSQKEVRIRALTGVAAEELNDTNNDGRWQCQRNLKQIALGMQQYVQDYDEKFPPAKRWCDVLYPYIKSDEVFHCPATNHNYGYAMNWRMSMKDESAINESLRDVLLYESLTQRRNHSGEGKGIAYRHGNGTNMAFADGHVKWYAQNAQDRWPDVLFVPR